MTVLPGPNPERAAARTAATPLLCATPLLRATPWVHGAALAATLARPQWWPWAVTAVAANHVALTAAGLLPRCNWLGSNWTRLPAGAVAARAVGLTLDDGPDPEVTPAVLEVLARHETRVTFFCIGARVRRHAALARAMVAAGHSVENHSEHHPNTFSLLGPAAMRREVLAAQDSIAQATGIAPRFFRAPAGLRNPFLAPILGRAGLQLASWTRRGFDTLDGDAARVLARLTRGLAARDILLLHDGHAACSGDGVPVVLAVLPRLLDALRTAGLVSVPLPAADAGA
ncbi:MAG: polysaccharide deacetylase family protein [Proteobacteria bacterium]|nr:polysaccharide deacetylase family protein [Pseudomonadota bacterium]